MKIIMNIAAALLLATLFGTANAASSDKPFAEKKVVLQISDNDPSKQTLVLNVASNLIKHYGPDKIDVEIVAFGPGVRLMFASNANKGRIKGLSEDGGVRFAACGNTLKKMTKLREGDTPEMHGASSVVPAGAVRIMDLVADGYVLLKP